MTSRHDIDWAGIKVDYEAGILSVRAIAKKHAVSDPAILKKAKIKGWTRDPKAQMPPKPEHAVSTAAVVAQVSRRKRINIDWEAIEREFRAGQLSVREIGRQFGVSYQAIQKAAKRNGWLRDLTDQVRHAIKGKLAEHHSKEIATEQQADVTSVSTGAVVGSVAGIEGGNRLKTAGQEEDIVDGMAERGMRAVLGHLAVAKRNLRVNARLWSDIEMTIEKRDEIVDAIIEETKSDKSMERRKAMMRAVSLPTLVTAAQTASLTDFKCIQIERQALNLDEVKPQEESYEDRLQRLHDAGAL